MKIYFFRHQIPTLITYYNNMEKNGNREYENSFLVADDYCRKKGERKKDTLKWMKKGEERGGEPGREEWHRIRSCQEI